MCVCWRTCCLGAHLRLQFYTSAHVCSLLHPGTSDYKHAGCELGDECSQCDEVANEEDAKKQQRYDDWQVSMP